MIMRLWVRCPHCHEIVAEEVDHHGARCVRIGSVIAYIVHSYCEYCGTAWHWHAADVQSRIVTKRVLDAVP